MALGVNAFPSETGMAAHEFGRLPWAPGSLMSSPKVGICTELERERGYEATG